MRVDGAEAARAAVDSQQAGAAIIIPADFSAKFADPGGTTSIELYKDPTLSIGPGIVESVLNQLLDSFSGAKIAVAVAVRAAGQADQALLGQVIQQFTSAGPAAQIFDVRDVAAPNKQATALATIIGPIMGWLTLFYAFFTGASTAQSILKEDEEGTLPRLFTTPTKHSTILGGKFLAVGLTVVVQMVVLFVLGGLVFRIPWGATLSIALVILGTILAASGFGIFINSMLKNTKQSGLIFGGLLTVMGMLGGLPVFVPSTSANDVLAKVGLFEPIGWAVRGLLQSMQSAPFGDILLSAVILAGWGVLFFIIGVLRFQKRYA
jgi:ABC-2 type transport system permease protein